MLELKGAYPDHAGGLAAGSQPAGGAEVPGPVRFLAQRDVVWLVGHPELDGLDEAEATGIVRSRCYREILEREAQQAWSATPEFLTRVVLADASDRRALAKARETVRDLPIEMLRQLSLAARHLLAQNALDAPDDEILGGFLVVLMEIADRERRQAESVPAPAPAPARLRLVAVDGVILDAPPSEAVVQ